MTKLLVRLFFAAIISLVFTPIFGALYLGQSYLMDGVEESHASKN